MRTPALSGLVPDAESFLAQPPIEPAVWRGSAVLPFTLDEVAQLLDHGTLGGRMVSQVKGGKRVSPAAYTWAGRPTQPGFADVVRGSALTALVADGATTVLESLHRTWRPIGDLCRRLSLETGVPWSANAYLTPAESQGFAHHHDTHSVLIVQTSGSKTWQLHAPVFEDPLEHQPFVDGQVSEAEWTRLREGTPFLEVVLQPGDALWIPRGWIHNGFATDEHSLHVSLSCPPVTPFWIAHELLRELGEDPAFRAELPWGFGRSEQVRTQAVETTSKLLAEYFAAFDAAAVGDRLAETYRAYHLESVRSPIDLFGPPVALDTPVRTVAEASAGSTWTDDGGLRVHLGDSAVAFEAATAGVVHDLLVADAVEPWTALDLALPDESALELVAALLRAGLASRA